MPKITAISITFDDPTVETDFYRTLSDQNPQAMIDALGLSNSVEDVQSITDDDRKTFVLGSIRAQLADNYSATKTQQAVAALQRAASATGKPLEAEPIQKKPAKG